MNSAPPKINSQTTGARLPAILLGVAALGVAATVFFLNPATHHFYPVCQFHRLTGLNCPGCGMTRAFYSLLHGEFVTALRDNALFVIVPAMLAVRGGWFFWNKRRGRKTGEFFPARYFWLLLVAMLVFTVLRNLPAFAFLSP